MCYRLMVGRVRSQGNLLLTDEHLADTMIPPLTKTLRSSWLPTTLRTSAISLLAQCANTSAPAVLPFAADLAGAMVDILQLETVTAIAAPKPSQTMTPQKSSSAETEDRDEEEDQNTESQLKPDPRRPTAVEFEPTSKNPKFPPLRRAALHFLTLLIRANTSRLYNSGNPGDNVFPTHLIRRVKTTLGYIAATDDDNIVRVMAREASEGLDQMTEAMLGI